MTVVSIPPRQKSWQIADEIASLLDALTIDGEGFGARLRELGRARGLGSDEDAARFVDVSYRQYQRWLSGESEPRASSLKKIADAFEIPLAELLGQPDPSQLDRIESELSRQSKLLEALQEAVEETATVRAQTAARTAQRRARDTPRKADRRRQA